VLNFSGGTGPVSVPGTAAYSAGQRRGDRLHRGVGVRTRRHGCHGIRGLSRLHPHRSQATAGIDIDRVPAFLADTPARVAEAALRAAAVGPGGDPRRLVEPAAAFVGRHLPHRVLVPANRAYVRRNPPRGADDLSRSPQRHGKLSWLLTCQTRRHLTTVGAEATIAAYAAEAGRPLTDVARDIIARTLSLRATEPE